jgi:hypothetical protein
MLSHFWTLQVELWVGRLSSAARLPRANNLRMKNQGLTLAGYVSGQRRAERRFRQW